MKEYNTAQIEKLINDILVGTTLFQFLYAGVFILDFESPDSVQSIVRVNVFSNVTQKELAKVPNDGDDTVQEYLESCRVLHAAFGLTVKRVSILPDRSLVVEFDDLNLFINSLHAPKYSILDRSWTISANRGPDFIEIVSDGKEELLANVSTSPIV